MNKIRVGILMDSLSCSTYVYETVHDLANVSNIDLYLLLNKFQKQNSFVKLREQISENGFLRIIDLTFFSALTSLERRTIEMTGDPDTKDHFTKKQINEDIFKEKIILHPNFSNTKVLKKKILISYEEEELKKIQALDFDLLIRGNVGGIFHGGILKSSKHGIISFHHGDNRWNRGGPPGFWEVYYKKPSTGFTIQILNEKLDDGVVIFRGEISTKPTYLANQIGLYQYANPFLKQIIIDFARSGKLPDKRSSAPYSNKLLRVPKITTSCAYLVSTGIKFASFVFRKKILKHYQRWSVAFTKTDWKTANLSKANVIKNPMGRFFADPFVITRDNQTIIFVEDYHYTTKRGRISAIKLLQDGSYKIISDVIKEDFHLSFPFVFDYQNELYMIPETAQSKTIRLYKCIQFPDKWEYQYDIMQSVIASDTILFEHSGKWWLLSNITPSDQVKNTNQLYAFMADSPISRDWEPHRKNPICISAEFGRNGGILRDKDNEVYRVRQKQGFNQYGLAFTIAKIRQISLDDFEENLYCEVEPNYLPNLLGTHHMNSDQGITVFDFVKDEKLS